MNREIDQFGWQTEFDIGVADKIRCAGRFLARVLRVRPQNAPAYMSEHYRALNEPSDGEAMRGAAFMLDQALDDHPQLPLNWDKE